MVHTPGVSILRAGFDRPGGLFAAGIALPGAGRDHAQPAQGMIDAEIHRQSVGAKWRRSIARLSCASMAPTPSAILPRRPASMPHDDRCEIARSG